MAELPPVPEDEFLLYGTLVAHPEKADQVVEILRKLTTIAKSEEGLLDYYMSRDTENPTVFHIFERYTGRAAFEKHTQQDLFQQLVGTGLLAELNPKILKPLEPLAV